MLFLNMSVHFASVFKMVDLTERCTDINMLGNECYQAKKNKHFREELAQADYSFRKSVWVQGFPTLRVSTLDTWASMKNDAYLLCDMDSFIHGYKALIARKSAGYLLWLVRVAALGEVHCTCASSCWISWLRDSYKSDDVHGKGHVQGECSLVTHVYTWQAVVGNMFNTGRHIEQTALMCLAVIPHRGYSQTEKSVADEAKCREVFRCDNNSS